MTFARPEMLYLVWLAPLLAAVCIHGLRRRQRILAAFAAPATRPALAPGASYGRRIVKTVLALLAVPLLAVSLAGFQYGYTWQTIERQGVSLMLALDCSQSMLATDVAPNRLERAKRKIHDLAGMLQGDKVGLVAFAGTAFVQCPLTLDYSGFDLFLGALSPEYLPVPGTDLAAAIRTALGGFDLKDGAERAIVLITDGESAPPEALKAAEEAAAQKVRIFCIGIGSPEGAPVPDSKGGFKKDTAGNIVHSRLDEETLLKIAATTGGTYVRSVAGDFDLETIYGKEIRGGMEAKTLSSGRKQLFEDRFRWFVGLALALLFADLLLPAARRLKRPAVRVLGVALLALLAAMSTGAEAANLAEQGLAAYEKQDYEAALKFFLDAQIKAPEDPVLAYDAGNAYYRLKKFDEARKNFQGALQTLEKQGKPSSTPLAELKPKALYNLGNAEFRLDRLPEAAKAYEQTLKLDPKDEDAKKNLEYVRKLLAERQEQEQKPPEEKKSDEKKSQEEKSEEKKEQAQFGEQKQDEGKQDSEQKQDEKQNSGQPDKEQGADKPPAYASSVDAADLQKQEQGPDEKAQAAAAQDKDNDGKQPQQPAAQNMDQNILNRLKDKPGMAAVPKYERRRVEKDW